MKVSIVIPNYNGYVLLTRNVPHVIDVCLKQKKICSEVIIVDDASTDQSVAYLESLIHQTKGLPIRLIKNDGNKGFSTTVNRGVSNAQEDIVVLLNTDVSPRPDFLDASLPLFSDPQLFAVAFMDESKEGKRTIKRGRGLIQWHRGMFIHSRGEVDKHDTAWVSCGSGIFRKSIWEKLGGLDELYNPFYWEDIDISYRARKSGYYVQFEPKSVVVHEHEKGAIQTNYNRRKIIAISYRNQFIFIWKNITSAQKLFSHASWLPYYIITALIYGDYMLTLGFMWAVLKLPLILKHRLKQKELYTLSDERIL